MHTYMNNHMHRALLRKRNRVQKEFYIHIYTHIHTPTHTYIHIYMQTRQLRKIYILNILLPQLRNGNNFNMYIGACLASVPDRKEGGLVLLVGVFVRMRQIFRISYCITASISVWMKNAK